MSKLFLMTPRALRYLLAVTAFEKRLAELNLMSDTQVIEMFEEYWRE